ncbi:MAG: MFS transporter [Bacilli bacterium]
MRNTHTLETTRTERLTYMLYFGGQNMVYIAAQMLLYIFYVSHLKLDPILVSTIMLATRTFDAVNDPFIGFLMDRFRLTKARYKQYINFGSFALPLTTLLVFMVPQDLSLPLTVTLVVITYLVWDVAFTLSDIPIFAVTTTMTKNEHERTKLLALSRVGSFLAIISIPIISIFQRTGNDNIDWFTLSLILAGLAFLFMFPQRWFIKERHNVTITKEKLNFRHLTTAILKNDQFILIMTLYLGQMFINAAMGYGAYVAEGYFGQAELGSLGSMVSFLGILPLALFAPAIIARIGKKRFMYIGSALTIVGSLWVWTLPPQGGTIAMLAIGLMYIGAIVPSIMRGMFTADCIEYGYDKTGVRAEGLSFSIQTFFNKLSDALGLTIAGLVMGYVGFDEKVGVSGNAPGVFESLHTFYALLPILMAVGYMVGLKFFYRLDEHRVREIMQSNYKDEIM